ncbi:DoxX family protein, partial [Burkholderia sp. Bp9142]|uniref:DoxX family protein n=3 Tax=unclassified Burkholderia TaxID=2613784 RepID=UPI000FA123B0
MTTTTGRCSPGWIRALLSQAWVGSLVRLALVSAFLIGGVNKAMHFGDAVAEQAHFGLHPPALWAALAVVVEIGGSLCVVFRRFT